MGDLLHRQCNESLALPPGGSGPFRAASLGDPGLVGVDKTLKILSIYVCGIKSKLKFPDRCNFNKNYDIIGVNETKLDNYDTLEIDGFIIFCLHRICKKAERSGGVALLVKTEFCKYV